jgi:hypothetical protein
VVAVRRLGIIVAFGALLGLFAGVVTAVPALAGGRGPRWQFEPAGPETLPADRCGFAVDVNPVANKGFVKELKGSDESFVILSTGTFKESFTNVGTGNTITENMGGPATVTFFPDGSVTSKLRGLIGMFLAPADAARFGLPPVSVTAGLVTISFDAAGNITSLSLTGHVRVDVCAALS